MATSYLAPGVYVEEVAGGSKPIEGVGTAVAGFIGFAAAPGFDLATGLGSFDAHALVSHWHSLVTGSGMVTVNNTINAGQVINPAGSLALSGNVVTDTGGPAPTGVASGGATRGTGRRSSGGLVFAEQALHGPKYGP